MLERNQIFQKSTIAISLALAGFSFSSSAIAESTLEEVVVTATKRAKSIQDVGLAVTAFGGDRIEELGAAQAIDLQGQTPNLLIKNAVGNTAPVFSIRGISLNDFATNGTQPVGVYVDEVYLVNNSQLGFQLFDTERVEVLKGPQGTLYGRNTTAGAVSFISRKPTEEFGANLGLTIGDYGFFKTEAAINGQIAEGLSGRLSGVYESQSDGFFTNTVTGDDHGELDRFGLRGQLLWDVNEDVSVLFNLHGGSDQSDNYLYTQIAIEPPFNTFPEGAALLTADANDNDIYSSASDVDPVLDYDSIGGSVTVNWSLGEVDLVSISAYEKLDYFRSEDFDATALIASNNFYNGDLTQYSQEFRLVGSSSDKWDWIVGAFYGKDELDEADQYGFTAHPIFAGLTLDEVYKQETTSIAIYSHNEFQLNDDLKLIAGIRYTDEERNFVGGTVGFAEVDTEITADEVTGRLGLDYNVTDDVLLYANYSRGYKSGGVMGFFAFVPEEKAPYLPEFIDAYEVGFKSTLADGTLRLNGAAFLYEYSDYQSFGSSNGLFKIFNISEAEITGFEADLLWAPAEGVEIVAGVGYLDTEVAKSTLPEVAEGNSLPNAPDLQLNLQVGYKWSVGNDLTAKVAVDASWQDDVIYTATGNPTQIQESYSLINGRIILAKEDDWSLSFWGKNLADEEYFGEIFSDSALTTGFAGAPRTFGITYNKKWY